MRQFALPAAGYFARKPYARSTAIDRFLTCPLLFLLVDRYGLTSPFSYSQALSRGSWLHACLEHFHETPNQRRALIERRLNMRLNELSVVMNQRNISNPETRQKFTDREAEDAKTTWAWFEAALQTTISHRHGTMLNFLSSANLIAQEQVFTWRCPELQLTFRIQVDGLFYDPEQKVISILDLKSTSKPAHERAQLCPIETQTNHYMFVVANLLKEGFLQTELGLPEDTTLHSMIHLIVEKPSIKFCDNDRNFVLDTSPLKSGPRKGSPRNERVYSGPPLIENYVNRCRDWYQGAGEYADLAQHRTSYPAINISFTRFRGLDPLKSSPYYKNLKLFRDACNAEPIPENFPYRPRVHHLDRDAALYLPFYVTNPDVWPDVIRGEGLIVSHRDDDASQPSGTTPEGTNDAPQEAPHPQEGQS